MDKETKHLDLAYDFDFYLKIPTQSRLMSVKPYDAASNLITVSNVIKYQFSSLVVGDLETRSVVRIPQVLFSVILSY